MADITLVVLLVLVAVISIGIYQKTSEQAAALRDLDQAGREWLAMQVRKERRAAQKADFGREGALRWLSDLVEESVVDVGNVYPDFRAAQLIVGSEEEKGVKTVLVTAMPESDFRRALKQAAKETRKLETLVVPSIPRRARAFSKGLSPDWVYFDLEAQAVGRALGIDWGSPSRLWVWK